MRIDRLLLFLRFVRSRSLAQKYVEEGHIRLNGRRVERCAQPVLPGDIMVLPLGTDIRAIQLVALPNRRGPASEAQACYQVLDETRAYPLAAAQMKTATKRDAQP